MSVKELIKTAMNKDATEFEAKFNDIMADKMTSAIENKYTDMLHYYSFIHYHFVPKRCHHNQYPGP